MTDKTYTKTRIAWPTVVVLALVLTALCVVWITGPEHRGDILAGVGALGAVLLASLPGMLRRARILVPLLLVALPLASGCGASALRTHARVAVVASSALAVSHATLVETCTALRDSCVGDAACIAPHRERCEAAAVAQDGARDAVDAYIGALEVAHLAGDGADVLGALMLALEVARRAWEGATRAFSALDIQLPTLPAGGTP